jgi:hypothetical protein
LPDLPPERLGDKAGLRYAADQRADIPKNRIREGQDTTTNRRNVRDAWAADTVLG